jgi:HEAT repeat protein
MAWQRLLILFSTIALATAPAFRVRGGEPTYKSKSLSGWLKVYTQVEAGSPGEKLAAEAVRAIGTNALPYLLMMITDADLEIRSAAEHGFKILGPLGAPAISKLAELTTATNELDMFWSAQALGDIGAPALSVLMQNLTHPRFKVGTQAALAIVALGTNALPAIPILLGDLRNPNHFFRERAAATLGGLHIEPETVVPGLMNLLNDPSPAARFLAIKSLGEFGPAARPAVPAMCRFVTNADLSYIAKEALGKIAPEVLTNAPPP